MALETKPSKLYMQTKETLQMFIFQANFHSVKTLGLSFKNAKRYPLKK